jgi:hypothetical protein
MPARGRQHRLSARLGKDVLAVFIRSFPGEPPMSRGAGQEAGVFVRSCPGGVKRRPRAWRRGTGPRAQPQDGNGLADGAARRQEP